MLPHQLDEIFGRITRQRGLSEVRIAREEVLRTAMNVGEIASSAAGDKDLFSDALCMVEDDYTPSPFTCLDGAHQASCPSANDDDVEPVHSNLASVAQLGEQPQHFHVEPDQRDHEAERAIPLHVLRSSKLGAALDEVEVEHEIQRCDSDHQ